MPLELPHDDEAERVCLGVALISPVAAERLVQRLKSADFYNPKYAAVFEIIAGLLADGRPVSPHAVLVRALERRLKGVDGAFIAGIIHEIAFPSNVGYYLGCVLDRAERRWNYQLGQQLSASSITDYDRTPQAHGEIMASALESRAARGAQSIAVPTMQEFLDADAQEFDWLIPGLLERTERIILTGPESFGKSTLGRQLAVCVAAGIHPFTQQDVPPMRVLVVDLENPEALSRRRYHPLWLVAKKLRECERHMWFVSRPDGLDLTSANDAAWLVSRVRKVSPDLLVVGPIYKMHVSDPNDEQAARKVTKVIDYIRARFGSAVLIEAHSPHGDPKTGQRTLRPYGASLWRRWPDMGIGLRPISQGEEHSSDRMCELVRWKPRDQRDWPRGLRAGELWPWIPMDEVELEMARKRK